MKKNIYVAATSQHVGKTTCTLGLVAALQQRGISVGYCKPVGQEFVDLGDLQVDKDALLFSTVMNFQLNSDLHSPVILGKGATTAYLENPENFAYREQILNADKVLNATHEIIVYEGTGHPGVGSVVELSNAEVAKILDASVVMIVEGGIGNTIDRLNMCLALFREKNIPIIGVIINKVLPDKVGKIEKYVNKWLKQENLKLLGILPYDRSLSDPIMETIRYAIRGKIVSNEHRLDNRIENIMPGSLVETHDFSKESNMLLVVSHHRLEEALFKIQKLSIKHELEISPLSGIIITGDHQQIDHLFEAFPYEQYVKEHEIPVITTHLDTYGAVVKISHIEVKINTRTPWKAQRAIELIQTHVNLEALL